MIEQVKKIEPQIIQRLVQLDKEAFAEGGMNEWHLVPIIRHGRVYVLKQGKEIIGSIQYLLDWDCRQKAYMVGVSIAKEFQGLGLGTKFIKESFRALAKEKITEVELTVDGDNAPAVKVYEGKLGFKVTDSRKNEYGDGEDRLVMILSLVDFAKHDVT